jgi:membrane-bound metal-dependent hydrolase YbcI (DUF457 family)
MMTAEMPSPLGHALAGLTVGLIADRAGSASADHVATNFSARAGLKADSSVRTGLKAGAYVRAAGHYVRQGGYLLAAVSAVVAMAPDLDLVYPPWHRTATHSIGATVLIMIVTAAVTGKVTGRIDWRWVWTLAAAHLSHLLLDWLGTDRFDPVGIQALWPVSHQYFLSGWDLFPPVERRLTRPTAFDTNLRAALYEIEILGSIAAATWALTRRRRSRVPTSARDIPPPPSAAATDRDGTSDPPVPRAAR